MVRMLRLQKWKTQVSKRESEALSLFFAEELNIFGYEVCLKNNKYKVWKHLKLI